MIRIVREFRSATFARGATLTLVAALLTYPHLAGAGDNASAAVATTGEVAHKQKMKSLFPDHGKKASQPTPSEIPRNVTYVDPSGLIETHQPNGTTETAKNAFFQNLGTNDRTCFSCHQPQDGWSLSAQHAEERFNKESDDPLFRLVDGAVCPSADISTLEAKRAAFSLLLNKGLIRVALPMQSSMQFEIIDVDDSYGCNTNSITGLTGSKSGFVSMYRRPLPSANLGFLSTIMWDGREPDLFHQAVDATLGHAQGTVALSTEQQNQIVSFEGCDNANNPNACSGIQKGAGVFTAQVFDEESGHLDSAHGASGGGVSLAEKVAKFFIGMNDPFVAGFTPIIFREYEGWDDLKGNGMNVARSSIARGAKLFNSLPIVITGVAGLNDTPSTATINGTCGTCHDTPSAGNHSVKAPLNIGVADVNPPVLDVNGLPVFTVWCTTGPFAGKIYEVTDLGRAMITGQCADMGKTKGPILRGLAARAPYFHNGSAATLEDVVNFYDQRFTIGLSFQDKAALVAFLKAL